VRDSAAKSQSGNPVETGNAEEAGSGGCRGWFLGHFIDPAAGMRHSRDVELKWGVHRAGDIKTTVAANGTAKTLSILVSGTFLLEFPDIGKAVQMARPGDYALWPAGLDHRWTAIEDCVVLTVRWPSLSGDQRARAPTPALNMSARPSGRDNAPSPAASDASGMSATDENRNSQ
jgi:hypothetical protein